MKEQLQNYLLKPFDFELGVKLFRFYFPDHNLLKILNRGYTISGDERMRSLLSTIDLEAPVVSYPVVKENLTTPKVVDVAEYSKVGDSEAEKIIFDLKREKARLFSEAAAAHLELTRFKLSEKERYMLALLIVENFEKIDEIWLTLDYYDEYKVLPNKYKYESDYEQAVKDRKRVLNLRTYISKLERSIPLMKSGAGRLAKENKLNEYKFELRSLEYGN